ncbi:allantoate deiminase [Alteribacillus persepolensis]|uniref:Allantoate deiminase n=1 Tax=Alteribacillus persepolensis TaxID=568899 RepID=A0A1G8F759_9BACI|nr:Zn-dependent hydrolase [Alteribacillus persepolensis]SDH77976.1 allantoate deiminase [Alteribacillus persepolensis]
MNIFSLEAFKQTSIPKELSTLINPDVLAERVDQLASIGRTEDGGVTRFVYTDEEAEAKALFRSWMEQAGLEVREDAVGNMYGRLEGENPSKSAVLTGSHLDSVPNGGVFDGVLGCISSLMAIEAIVKEQGKLDRTLELVVFVDEEGARFGSGLYGSRTAMGEVDKEEMFQLRDENGMSMAEAMKIQGYAPNKIKECTYPKEDVCAFLELHIEQGKQLERNQHNIGVVNGIAGPCWLDIIFTGDTDHAGNTPMTMRHDAAAGAAELIVSIEGIPREISSTAVATVGKLQLYPNGANVIAGKAEMTVDVRDIDESVRDDVLHKVKEEAERIAKKRGLQTEYHTQLQIAPVPVPKWIQTSIKKGADKHQLSYQSLPSGASHDAMILGKYVPSGLIFVPSRDGKSHTPEELTSLADCLRGVIVLKEVLMDIGNS